MNHRAIVSPATVAAVLSLLLAGALVYGAFVIDDLRKELAAEQAARAAVTYESGQLAEKIESANALIEDLKALLAARLAERDQIGEQVSTLSSTVRELDKLSKVDRQLLAKYSSVYFLNENYAPANLTAIDDVYLSRPDRDEYFVGVASSHLKDMLDAARAANVPLQILSAYRSFETQAALKEGYKVTYGAGTANAFSADQGYSEHQLGTTVDFTMPEMGGKLVGFDKTAGYPWLLDNAHRFGFVISYPKGNGYFMFEPWHWRYVGVALATKLYTEKKSFYDLDQREIDTYLTAFID